MKVICNAFKSKIEAIQKDNLLMGKAIYKILIMMENNEDAVTINMLIRFYLNPL